MSLGQRLALAAVLAAVPLFLGVEWLRRDLEQRAVVDGLAQFAITHMESGGREACEADPQWFGGPLHRAEQPQDPRPRPTPRRRPQDRGPGPGGPRAGERGGLAIWAYDASFTSANLRAPAIPAALQHALAAGRDVVSEPMASDDELELTIAVRTPWPDGPCAFVQLTRFAPPADQIRDVRGTLRNPFVQWAALAIVVALATMLAAWPLVRRVRRLTAGVERAARSGYVEPVTVSGNDELAGLARAFNAAGEEIRGRIDALEESAAALRTFLSNTTHDVMQPLTVLQGHLGTIRRRLDQGETPDRGLVTACQEEAHYVASLVHNLTSAARLESGAVPVRTDRLDLRTVVERAVARHRPMAESRQLSLDAGLPESEVAVDGDITLLEQAIGNLVHNAVRHNTTGQHVAVVLERTGSGFALRVVDDGPGVDEAQLEHLAERRFRTDAARQRDPGGQGLGLAISREVAARHGFELTFARPDAGGFEARLSGPLASREDS